MRTNDKQLRNRHICLILVAIMILLIPQTGWAKWKIQKYEQSRNDDGDGPYTWVTGNITQTHSKYYEADAIPFRLYMTGLTVGTHTLEMKYQCTKGGKLAYDYLVSWDHSEPDAPITEDIDISVFTGPTLFPIPLDPYVTDRGVTQLPGNLTLYNGTITDFSTYTHDGDTTADCHTRFTITFTADGTEILLAWGGHISTLYDWGEGNSASYIPGSPYHMSLLNFDGASTGNKDLATAASAVEVLELDFGDAPDPTYPTLLASNGPSHVIAFNMSLGPTVYPEPDGLPTPKADGDDLNAGDDEEGVVFPAPLVAGLLGIIEVDGGPSGGLLDAWIDFDGNGQFDHPAELLNGGSVVLTPGPGNIITIPVPLTAVPDSTYARFRLSTVGGLPPTGPADDGEVEDHMLLIEQQVGMIIIEKQTLPDGSPEIFTFTGDANGALSDGQQITVGGLPAGTYTSQELVPPGWELTSISVDDGNSTFDLNTATATFVLDPGEIITAVFTNTQRGSIIIEKQTDPDGAPDSFTFTGDASGTIADNGQIVVDNLLPGQYTSQEIIPAGWNLTSIVLDDANSSGDVNTATANFVLEPGETVKAIFTNTLQRGTIIIEKQTDPDGAPDSFTFTGDASGTIADNGQIVVDNLLPGQYKSQEIIPAGWDLTSIILDDANSSGDVNTATANFVLEPGETVKAIFTNTLQHGTIIIEKQTDPDGAADPFTFSGDASGIIRDNEQIVVDDLLPGQYTSQEIIPTGWDLTSIVLDDANSSGDVNTATANFVLEPGETVKAIFTNTLQRGTIIIEKQTDPDGAPDSFTFTGDISGIIRDNEQIIVNDLAPGRYSTQEVVPAGWVLTSIVLDDDNSTFDLTTAYFNLDAGETVKAVFTNTLKVTEIEVEKDADVFRERTYEWDIQKTVQPAEWHLFHGESGESQYTVRVTRSVQSDRVTVSGQICVTNTGQIPTSGLTYIDSLQYRTPQMNDWGDIEIRMDSPAAIPPGETDCYDYTFTFEAIPEAEYRNVAVARITNFAGHEGQLFGRRHVIPVILPDVPDKENNPLVHVDDTNGNQWEFTDSGSETYNQNFNCDAHEGTNTNTATILETQQSATANVTVSCYELEVEKDAKTSFNRYYQWMIDKQAEAERMELAACFEEQVAYTVTVDTTGYEDGDFMVTGTIKIHNPAPMPAQINSLEDLLNGQPAQLECQPQFPLIIEPGGTFECDYQKDLPTGEALVNTATAVQQLFTYPFSGQSVPLTTMTHEGTAEVIFTNPDSELDDCVTVTDTNLDPALLGSVCAANAPKTFEYSLTVGPYYSSGEHIINNTATYKTSDTGTEGSDSWTLVLDVECVPPVANFEADYVDGISPMTVQFTDLSENAIRWLWEFGDGTTSTEQHPVHVFRNPPLKYYTVKLTVWGCCEDYADTMVKESYIRVTRAAEVKFNASPLVVAIKENVQFKNECGGGVNQFEWDFGDGHILNLRHNVMAKIHPTHSYDANGTYSVSLRAYGQGGEGTFTVKDMIYVDQNFINMKFIAGSKTLLSEPWENAMNHDIISPNANAVALNNNAYVIFGLLNDATPIRFNKLRILSNNGLGTRYSNHLIKEFELWVSMDNVTYEKALTGILARGDMWKVFEFPAKIGKYVKLAITSAQGSGSPYVTLGEIQLFGKPPVALALLRDVDGLDIVDWEPVTEFRLENAYPNPFNPITTLEFALPTDERVQLEVYNIRGQLVSTILNHDVPAGRYRYHFDAGDLNSGIYFYRFRSGKFQQIKRMTFLK